MSLEKKIAKYIKEMDTNNFSELLLIAVANKDVKTVRYLLEKKVDVNYINSFTALSIAARSNFVGITKLLLKAGANPDLSNKDGFTPLHSASGRGHVAIVRALLKAGADSSIKTPRGNTALDLIKDRYMVTATGKPRNTQTVIKMLNK